MLHHPILFRMARAEAGEPSLVIDRARNALLVDSQGQAYIDAAAGLWCVNLGYGHPALVNTAATAMARLSYAASFGGVATEPALRLADALLQRAEQAGLKGLDRVFFGVSGSEANETALKMARLAATARGEPERCVVLSLEGGFHGLTAAATHITAVHAYQQSLPASPNVVA